MMIMIMLMMIIMLADRVQSSIRRKRRNLYVRLKHELVLKLSEINRPPYLQPNPTALGVYRGHGMNVNKELPENSVL